MGEYLIDQLGEIPSRHVKEVRGKGLLIGVELKPEAGGARRFCEALETGRASWPKRPTQCDPLCAPLIITARPSIGRCRASEKCSHRSKVCHSCPAFRVTFYDLRFTFHLIRFTAFRNTQTYITLLLVHKKGGTRMNIGIPKERRNFEYRVGLTPTRQVAHPFRAHRLRRTRGRPGRGIQRPGIRAAGRGSSTRRTRSSAAQTCSSKSPAHWRRDGMAAPWRDSSPACSTWPLPARIRSSAARKRHHGHRLRADHRPTARCPSASRSARSAGRWPPRWRGSCKQYRQASSQIRRHRRRAARRRGYPWGGRRRACAATAPFDYGARHVP